MEKYIKKINDKLLKKNDLNHAKKVKKRYRAIGGTILAVGLAGIIACMTAFVVFFLQEQTEKSFLAWELAIPFVLIFVAGSVVTRIGDQLLKGVNLKQTDNAEDAKEAAQKTEEKVAEEKTAAEQKSKAKKSGKKKEPKAEEK